ncbi:hypothetical protein NMY22_g14630 [Coprinellus aureogranulatus]|nr:hypothetical protein NMY22_g14630 [Coprinellus aureogranulatus]
MTTPVDVNGEAQRLPWVWPPVCTEPALSISHLVLPPAQQQRSGTQRVDLRASRCDIVCLIRILLFEFRRLEGIWRGNNEALSRILSEPQNPKTRRKRGGRDEYPPHQRQLSGSESANAVCIALQEERNLVARRSSYRIAIPATDVPRRAFDVNRCTTRDRSLARNLGLDPWRLFTLLRFFSESEEYCVYLFKRLTSRFFFFRPTTTTLFDSLCLGRRRSDDTLLRHDTRGPGLLLATT